MIKELASSIPTFPGVENQVRCFAHVLNLVAKTIIRQFDVEKTARTSDGDLEAATDEVALQAAALSDVISGLEDEIPELVGEDELGEDEVDDDVDGWIDERGDLSADEKEELRASVLPVKLILAKVSLSHLLPALLLIYVPYTAPQARK